MTRISIAALIAAVFLTGMSGKGAANSAETPDNPLHYFATCLGRVSAQWSHAAARSDTAAIEAAEALRQQLAELVDAMTPHDAGRQVLSWRVEARAAHAALLSRATLHDDTWAADRAASMIESCSEFVITPDPITS